MDRSVALTLPSDSSALSRAPYYLEARPTYTLPCPFHVQTIFLATLSFRGLARTILRLCQASFLAEDIYFLYGHRRSYGELSIIPRVTYTGYVSAGTGLLSMFGKMWRACWQHDGRRRPCCPSKGPTIIAWGLHYLRGSRRFFCFRSPRVPL